MTNIVLVIVFLLLIIITALLFQYAGHYAYNYKIREAGIEIALFGKIPLKRILFCNIAEIKKISYKETLPFKSAEMFSALRFGNRILGEIVLVRQKKGITKIVLLTPDNANIFIHEVQQRLHELASGQVGEGASGDGS